MSKSVFVFLVGISIVIHVLVADMEISKRRADLLEIANKVLEEQVADLEGRLNDYRAAKTYDDGLLIGIQMGESSLYTEGYHKGLQHGVDHANVSKFTYTSKD